MSEKKQTENEELFGILCNTINGANFDDLNEAVYKIFSIANYHKQSEGEWKKVYDKAPRYVCTACNHLYNNKEYKYCPNCGSKMKGGGAE